MRQKKVWAAMACAAVAVVALAGCGEMGSKSAQEGMGMTASSSSTASQAQPSVTAEQAREIALTHAGLSADEATVVHEGTDTEYGRLVHEVEFYTGSREYDYTIDAETGEVMSFDEDTEHSAVADWYRDTPPSTDSSAFIGEDAAKAAALESAGLAESDVENMRVALDYDEREPRYEVEFDADGKSYEYEIYALDGAVMSFETVRM